MAQPGVAEGNGVAEPHILEQPAPTPQAVDQAAAVGAKRKRDEGEDERVDGVAEEGKGSPPVNGVMEGATRPNEKALIRTIYRLLKEYVNFPARLFPNDFIALTLCPVLDPTPPPLSSTSRYHHQSMPSPPQNAQSPKTRHHHPPPSRRGLRMTSTLVLTSSPTIYRLLSGRAWLRTRQVPALNRRRRLRVFETKPLNLSGTNCRTPRPRIQLLTERASRQP
ncbi:hypothetical protein IMZ48_16910 [Candidatus Bathyarchaeota archaeon]|nr:hypothetical protein [Candidatus Bathyarchaeota archaeon]